MKPFILFLTVYFCFATDLGTDIQQLQGCSQHLKTLVIDCFDHLEYNYFKHFYPELVKNYEGRNKKLEKGRIGDVFFEPVEDFKWKVHNYRGEKDQTLTDHFETALKKMMQEPDLTPYETHLKEIYEKTHKRVIKSCNTVKRVCGKESKLQLSKEEKETMHMIIIKSMSPIYGDSDIILKFLILISGTIAESEGEIDKIVREVICKTHLHPDKSVLLMHALRCLEKLNTRVPRIAAMFVCLGTLQSLKLFQSVFGKEILNSKYLGRPVAHYIFFNQFLTDFLYLGFDKLKWMIEEQGVDPTIREITFFGSIDAVERFKMSVKRTEDNKTEYDEITGYLCNEIEAAESKKSFKRKIKDCIVNKSFFNCEPLKRKIFKH